MTDCVVSLHLFHPPSDATMRDVHPDLSGCSGARAQRGRLSRSTSLNDCWSSITPGHLRWNQFEWQASLLAAPSKSSRINYLSKPLCSFLSTDYQDKKRPPACRASFVLSASSGIDVFTPMKRSCNLEKSICCSLIYKTSCLIKGFQSTSFWQMVRLAL